ncbi:MAG TPA: MFS transporter [Solirubrobacteraceae bacterium]|nr:MFS transporter [Solirubrobacteraceae bacterium]
MSALALVLFVQAQKGSYVAAGLVAAAGALAAGLAAPLRGRVVDRLGQTPVLLGSVALQLVAALALVGAGLAGAPVGVLAGLAALTGAGTPPLSPCLRGLWPMLLDDRNAVRTALALDALLIEAVFIGGPLLVAGLVAVASPQVALLAAAGLSLGGTLMFAAQPPSRTWRGEGTGGRGLGALASPGLRTLLVAALGMGVFFGTLEVALPAFADERASSGLAGVALAAVACGSAAGGLLYGARSGGRSLGRLHLALAAALPLAAAPLALVDSVTALLALAPLAGVVVAPLTAAQNELAGSVAPAGTATEAYAWVLTALVGGVAAGNAVAGAVVEAAGWRAALVVACGCTAVSALAVLARRRTLG